MPGKPGKRGRRYLRSVSLPVVGGGIAWATKPGEYEVMKDLFSDVGRLRVLSFPIEHEGEEYVNESILNIRKELTSVRLPDGSASEPNIRSMQEACNAYLQATPGPQGYQGLRPHFEDALWRWRETVYEDVKSIGYGLKLDEALRLMKAMLRSFGRPA